jgi:DNA-binding CsgD family transcriptional regulator
MSDTAEPKRRRRIKGVKATPNTCSTSPQRIRIAKRRAEALDLRAIGYSFRQIGERLKISTAQASDDVTQALEEITAEPAHKLLKLELRLAQAHF